MEQNPRTVRRLIFLLPLLFCISCTPTEQEDESLTSANSQYVDPFIGTGGHGHTYPGATLPFGMVQLSPDTRLEGWDGCSGYHYSDSVVYGFSHTHLSGTGVSDYGDILFMPVAENPSTFNGYPDQASVGYASAFEKSTEKASPGYYAVTLSEGNVKVELTATENCGIHKYDFGNAAKGHVVVDLAHRDQVLDAVFTQVNETEIEGYRISKAWAEEQHVYFVARFSSPIDADVVVDSLSAPAGSKAPAAILGFSQLNGKPLEVQVGISPVDINGARKNLDAQAQGKDFEELRKLAEKKWNHQLGIFELKGGSEKQYRTFYTALYHSFLAPNLFSDSDGRFRGMDGKIHQLDRDKHYSVFSLWDTFRATHPLLTIVEPERTNAFIRTFLRHYENGGRLPIWELSGNYTGCMIGYHAIPVIADAYVKGLRAYDSDLALKAMKHSAELDWLGLDAYKDHGYIGAGEEAESVSKTLEYAYDDWCIATLAEALGDTATAAEYFKRAENYIHLFDPETHFFRARMNGGWQAPFDPSEVNFNFTEANAWQYSGFAPQNIHNLIRLHGGPSAFVKHLDQLFSASTETTGREQADITGLIGQYAHGNEPSHHMAYLYAFTPEASKGQARLRQIMDELYDDQPDGLSGNEDCGQMSSWYVFSAMGFYPVTPGSDQYVLGTPLFPEIHLTLPNSEKFSVLAPGVSSEKPYVQSVKLNGEKLNRSYLLHSEIVNGGKLEFEMGSQAKDDWYSELPGDPRDKGAVPAPIISASAQTFTDSLQIRLATASPADIFYSLDGSTPSIAYSGKAIPIDRDILLSAQARHQGKTSPVVQSEFFKIEGGRSISLASEYANQYAAGGDQALIDHLRGGPNFRTGRWQGYREDFEGTVDLGSAKSIHEIEVGFLQDIKSWIWMPKSVEIEGSMDGKSWTSLSKGDLGIPDDRYGAFLGKFQWKGEAQTRYVRVRAKQYGVCPPWHLGAGGATWIFIDEIAIR